MADSMRWQMASALAALPALTGLTYTGNYDQTGPVVVQGTYPIPVYLRQKAVPDKNQDTVPSIILVSEHEQPPDRGVFGGINHFLYPFLFIFVQNNGHVPQQLQLMANVREIIRGIMFDPYVIGPLEGLQNFVTPQWNVRYDPNPSFNAGLWGPEFEASAQKFTLWVSEKRSAKS